MSCMMKLGAAVIDSHAQGRSLKSHDSYVNSNRSHEVIPALPLSDLSRINSAGLAVVENYSPGAVRMEEDPRR